MINFAVCVCLLSATTVIPTAAAALLQDHKPSGVAGRWKVQLATPHGEVSSRLDLEQEGTTVTGTFTNPHGDQVQVRGEFRDGKLTLAAVRPATKVRLEGTLDPDGHLKGTYVGATGERAWKAQRVVS